jgi:purine catabolism regulator
MGVEVVCFCQTPGDDPRPEAILALAEAIYQQAEHEFPETPLRGGIGAPAADLDAWRLSFRQAGQALEMARRFNERRPLYYPDLSVYRLLLQMETSPELAAFLEETLGRLLAHESASELLRTLGVYFEHNGNLSQTAEALFIHRNTLLYRMERIAAITGLNLDHAETRLAVQLALHIRRMMGARANL